VVEAADGREALSLLEPLPLAIEAVVTDIMMPDVRGDELLDVLASNRPGLALVAMTAGLEHPLPRSVSVLIKPFSTRLLATVLDGAITRARRLRADALQQAADAKESRSIARAQRVRAAQMRANVDLMKEVLARRQRLAAGGLPRR
jgi:CheY-like chemotaxis protein